MHFMDPSILPFLPSLHKAESGALEWPSQLAVSLKLVKGGPSVSQIHSTEALCDFFNNLREQSCLPLLSTAVTHGIATYFDECVTPAAAQNFYDNVLPFMADLTFRLPVLLNDDQSKLSIKVPPPSKQVNLRVLRQQQPGLVYMTQELAAALLASLFFCLCPWEGRDEARLPDFTFEGLFHGIGNKDPQQEQKVHCLMHYFKRVSQDMPQGMISFERKVLSQLQHGEVFSPISEPDESYWSRSLALFSPIQVLQEGTIEDQSLSALEIDFANRYLGGGVLGWGCVQEEIRFVISPELIVGMLFMPAMLANEAIEIKGAERFSRYKGYAFTFSFAGDYIDTKARDSQGRRETRVVAIDALSRPGQRQYDKTLMLRETNKAFCGFLDHMESFFSGLPSHRTDDRKSPSLELQDDLQTADVSHSQNSHSDSCKDQVMPSKQSDVSTKRTDDTQSVSDLPGDPVQNSSAGCTVGIATGNWGCGAFGGDVELKSLLQWVAASQAGRPFVQYFTFGGSNGPRLQEVAERIISEKWTVGELWGLLVDYGEKRLGKVHRKGLFEWILPQLSRAGAAGCLSDSSQELLHKRGNHIHG